MPIMTHRLTPKCLVLAKALLLLATLLAAACDTTIGTRSSTEVLPRIEIPGAPVPSSLRISLGVGLSNPAIDLGSADNFVTFVTIRNLNLRILESSDTEDTDDGAEDSFDFLTGLEISLRADFDGQTNELLVARLPDGDPQFGSAARTLTLTVVAPNINVLDFLDAPGGYDVVLRLNGTVPPDNILISGEIRYRVGLGLAA